MGVGQGRLEYPTEEPSLLREEDTVKIMKSMSSREGSSLYKML
jgi:hypothetical protein